MSQPEILPESSVEKASAAYIQIRKVSKKFDAITAVDNVTLNIRKGEIFALLGASGCGKSTLLRLLAGFEVPTEGQITIDGEDMGSIQPYNRPINMMFQSYALFPQNPAEITQGNIVAQRFELVFNRHRVCVFKFPRH